MSYNISEKSPPRNQVIRMHNRKAPPPTAGDAPQLLKKAVDWLIRSRIILLTLCAAAAVLAYRPSSRLDFNRSIEGLFHQGDSRLANYLEDKEIFGGTETVLVAYTDPDLFTVSGLERLQNLDSAIVDLSGVRGVLSLAKAKLPGSPLSARSLHEHLTSGIVTPVQLREEITACDLYADRLISADGNTTALLVSLVPAGHESSSRDETIARIRKICDEYNPRPVLAGAPVIVDDVYRHLENDGRLLGIGVYMYCHHGVFSNRVLPIQGSRASVG